MDVNLTPERMALEVKVFNTFKNIILGRIANFNRMTKESSDPDVRKVKIVISGGAAFAYHIKVEGSLLETHDFDLRIVYDDYVTDPTQNDTTTSRITSSLNNLKEIFLTSLVEHMNIVYNSSEMKTFKEEFGENLVEQESTGGPFYVISSDFLSAIIFDYRILEGEFYSTYQAGIVDITPFTRFNIPYYGLPNDYETEAEANIIKDIKDGSRYGFLRTFIGGATMAYDSLERISPVLKDVYCISFGYMLWDTIRMLVKIENNPTGSHKLKRYLFKYLGILRALDFPEDNLLCNSPRFYKYAEKCAGV